MMRLLWLSLCLMLSSLVPAPVAAQNQNLENNPNYVKVSHWEMHVIGGGGRVVEKEGPFPDQYEALQAGIRWSKRHPDNIGLMTAEREIISYQSIRRGGSDRPQEPTSAKNSTERPGVKTAPVDRLGGKWQNECGPFFFKEGKVQHLCKGTPFSGTYELQGNSIVIDLGNVVIRGTLVGGSINGTLFKNGTMVKGMNISKAW